jgi:molybdate transport system regulatory protein
MSRPKVSIKLVESPSRRTKDCDQLELLERIDALGSITAAAKVMGIGYRTAWLIVDAINKLSDQPIIIRKIGGPRGGSTVLTLYGRRVLTAYQYLRSEWEKVPANVEKSMGNLDR